MEEFKGIDEVETIPLQSQDTRWTYLATSEGTMICIEMGSKSKKP